MARKPEVAAIPLNLLIVDPAVQRPLDVKRIDKLAAQLDLDAIGLICVSRRNGDVYSIIDGQHRVAALRAAGFADDTVECEIFSGLSLSEEAAMFRHRNFRSSVQKVDLFRVRVVEGDETAVAIHALLLKYGWKVQNGSHAGYLNAIDAFERVWLKDAEGVPTSAERTIDTITSAWGLDQGGADRSIITGLGSMFLHYRFAMDLSTVIARLKKLDGGPVSLLSRARGLQNVIKGQLSSSLAEIVVEEYNRGKRSLGVTAWRAR